jgi:hypothetical protein
VTDPLTARAVISDDVLVQEVSGEAVLLDLATETYFGLNPAGARFWTLLGRLGSGARAVSTMAAEFEVSAEELETDMTQFLQHLVAKGLVTLAPADDHSNPA